MQKLGKITISLKSPDALQHCVNDYLIRNPDIDEETIREKLTKFVQWSEYVTVEIDLDNQTAKVLET